MSDDITLALERASLEDTEFEEANLAVARTSEQNSLSINSSLSLSIHFRYHNFQFTRDTTTPSLPSAVGQDDRSNYSSVVLYSKDIKPDPNSAKPGQQLLFLDLPYEVRGPIYDVLLYTPRTVALNLFTPSERRVSIFEPLRQTCKDLRAEIEQWGLSRPDLLSRNPMWGLYNPHLTQVCVRFLGSFNRPAHVFIGNPLTPDDVDKIAVWWRCMRNGHTDYFGLVNNAICWDKLIEENRNYFHEYAGSEFEAEIDRYMMPWEGVRVIEELPL